MGVDDGVTHYLDRGRVLHGEERARVDGLALAKKVRKTLALCLPVVLLQEQFRCVHRTLEFLVSCGEQGKQPSLIPPSVSDGTLLDDILPASPPSQRVSSLLPTLRDQYIKEKKPQLLAWTELEVTFETPLDIFRLAVLGPV